ncbi:MAG: STAS domain-containing protein [Actinomycetota bacterium]
MTETTIEQWGLDSKHLAEGMQDFWKIYEAEYDSIQKELLAALSSHPEFAALLSAMSEEQMAEQNKQGFENMRLLALEGDWDHYLENLREQGSGYARSGLSFSSWFAALTEFRNAIVPRIRSAYADDSDRMFRAIDAVGVHGDVAMATIGETYLSTKQEIIGQQQEAIRELSAPVLVLGNGLLMLPLIGVVDSDRARMITQNLLDAIGENRARAVVMDITGVPIVDSMVANHLTQTAHAAGFMGAKVVVTGVSTDVAQTLVRIGVDSGMLDTVGDLQSGIEVAQRYLGNWGPEGNGRVLEASEKAEEH